MKRIKAGEYNVSYDSKGIKVVNSFDRMDKYVIPAKVARAFIATINILQCLFEDGMHNDFVATGWNFNKITNTWGPPRLRGVFDNGDAQIGCTRVPAAVIAKIAPTFTAKGRGR